MQEYEYMSYEICMARAEQEKEVEKMAKQGWRLVSVAGYVFWFERHLTLFAEDLTDTNRQERIVKAVDFARRKHDM